MITLAPYIDSLERARFGRYAAMLAANGALDLLCAAPEEIGCAGDFRYRAVYRDGMFEGRAYPTEMTIEVPGVAGVLRSGLSDALRLVTALHDDSELLRKTETLSPGAEDETILATFAIDPDATCRASVGAWASDEYLAPHEGGYAYYLVEPYGEIVILSWSATLAPVALHLAVSRSSQARDLGSRIGKIEPLPLSPS